MQSQHGKDGLAALVIWAASDFYYIISVVTAILLGMLSPDIQQQLILNSTQLGLLGSAFFLSYGISQFVAGRMMDAYGPRLILIVTAIISVAGLYLFASAQSFVQALLGQVLAGIGLSSSYIGVLYLARMWFSDNKFPLITGITQMSANLIAAGVMLSLAFFSGSSIHFRSVMTNLAMVTLLVVLLMYLFVRHEGARESSQTVASGFWVDTWYLLRCPQFMLSTLYFSAAFGVMMAFVNLWNTPYEISLGHSLRVAAMMNAMLPVGGAIGAVLSGWLVMIIGSRSTVSRFYIVGMLVTMCALIYGPGLSIALSFTMLALTGFFLGGSVLGFALADQHISSSLRGTGFGLMAAVAYLSCALLQYLVGFILGDTLEPAGGLAALHEFRVALSPLVITLAIGSVGSWYLRDAAK